MGVGGGADPLTCQCQLLVLLACFPVIHVMRLDGIIFFVRLPVEITVVITFRRNYQLVRNGVSIALSVSWWFVRDMPA